MPIKHTCIVRDKLYEAVDFESVCKEPDLRCACDLCVASSCSKLCTELGDCLIGGRYHYWREAELETESETEPEIVHTCATCMYLNFCSGDPTAEACPSYEPSPGLSGCCSALLLVAGFAGFIACACFAVFTH